MLRMPQVHSTKHAEAMSCEQPGDGSLSGCIQVHFLNIELQ